MPGIYIHIPFCKSFCTYCGFYSVCDMKRTGDFLDSLFREVDAERSFFTACGGGMPSTLYIGGGTPSALPVSVLGSIEEKVRGVFRGGVPFEEFTVEVNPDDVSEDMASGLKAIGVTRVSMGVQSFDDRALKWMNRRHTAAGALRACGILRDAGFGNISMDLIFGYLAGGESPTDGMERWKRDLERMKAIGPEHISAYQLSVEPGSAVEEMCAAGRYAEPDDEYCALQYGMLQKELAGAGYEQYEISNFARMDGDGPVSPFRSRHNSSYWTREPYLGLGPAAHSFDGKARSWNADDLDRYISGRERYAGRELLSPEEVQNERIMLGLRTKDGVPAEYLSAADARWVSKMVSTGSLAAGGGRVRIPPEKWFVSDDIIAGLMK